jgi:hypothetical protein
MKILKTYEKFIRKENINDIYKKYYSDIPFEIFKQIVESDPTSLIDGELYMGKYCKWLLKLYIDKILKLEDLYKVTIYLNIYDKFKSKMVIKDINKIKSLPLLFEQIKDYIEYDNINYDEKHLTGQFKEVFKNDKYRIIIPLTLEASKYFGRETEWCTTNTDMFKYYTKKQNANIISIDNLYILYCDDLNDRYQFHFHEKQFMNIYDSEILLERFMPENDDIYDFFSNAFTVEKYYSGVFIGFMNIKSLKTDIKGLTKYIKNYPYGDFACNDNVLTTLEGCPSKVIGDFNCNNNSLKNLIGGPTIVDGDYMCSNNPLTSLEGCPRRIENDFYCAELKDLETLEYFPEYVGGDVIIYNTKSLTKKDINNIKKFVRGVVFHDIFLKKD